MGEAKLIFIVIFMIIALIRAIRNSAMNRPGGQQVDADAVGRRRKVQSDIDAFLSEVEASAASKAAPDSARSGSPQTRGQRTADARSQDSSRKRRKREQRRQRQQQQAARTPPQPSRERQALAERSGRTSPVGERPLGSGISEHVATHIAQHTSTHLDSEVEDSFETDIVHSVASHLGHRSTELPALTKTTTASVPSSATAIRQLLSSRDGVRQAILLNEILSRPRSLRR